MRGDRSETFSFVSWFPPFLHRPVTAISNFLYSIFLRLGVVQPWQYSAMGDVELGVGSGLPGMSVGIGGIGHHGSGIASGGGSAAPYGTRAEAERRRAMALKALDQRVKAGGSTGAGARPDSPAMGVGAGASASPYTSQGEYPGITVPAAAAAAAAPVDTRAAAGNAASLTQPSAQASKAGVGAQAGNGSPVVPRVVVQEASEDGISPTTERPGTAAVPIGNVST